MALSRGAGETAVRDWQRFLAGEQLYRGKLDADFGPLTEAATKGFQQAQGVAVTGIVDDATLAAAERRGFEVKTNPAILRPRTEPAMRAVAAPPAIVLPAIRFIQAKNYRYGRKAPIDYIVIHSMEASEKGNTAEAVASWFAGSGAPLASAHYCIDNDSIVQCVRDVDTAFHAPGVNHNGLGFEHAGFARQTAEEWLDEYSAAMLRLSAALAGMKAKEFGVPLEWVDAAGLLLGRRGFTRHMDVAEACRRAQAQGLVTTPFYNRVKDKPLTNHSDPGVAFPRDLYLGWAKEAA